MSVQQDERRGQDRRDQSAGQRNGRRTKDEHDQFGAAERDAAYRQNQTPTDRYWGVLEKIAPEE